MIEKFSEARQAAFVKAGGAGNQGLAAARAKVSRSWVTRELRAPRAGRLLPS